MLFQVTLVKLTCVVSLYEQLAQLSSLWCLSTLCLQDVFQAMMKP